MVCKIKGMISRKLLLRCESLTVAMKILNLLLLSMFFASFGCKTTSSTSTPSNTDSPQQQIEMTLASVAGTDEQVKLTFQLDPDEIERNVAVEFKGEEDWRFVNKKISVPHSIAVQTEKSKTKVVISEDGTVSIVPNP